MLRAVADGAYANLELPQRLRAQRLTGRDAAFATELAYGALRLQGRYDPMVAMAAGRALDAIDAKVLDTLRETNVLDDDTEADLAKARQEWREAVDAAKRKRAEK